MEEIIWRWYAFAELAVDELYALLKVRQQVFVVEQQCAYLDCDGADQNGWHLVGWQKAGKLTEPVAYLRVIIPKCQGEGVAIGRLLVTPRHRGKGQGAELLTRALDRIAKIYPETEVKISAQHYLLDFYRGFGFAPTSDIYEEDGIPHIAMIRPPA